MKYKESEFEKWYKNHELWTDDETHVSSDQMSDWLRSNRRELITILNEMVQ